LSTCSVAQHKCYAHKKSPQYLLWGF
jgi:hypothetical protein